MSVSEVTMRRLLEAGFHYGHVKSRVNNFMYNYIFGERNGVHIIDLDKTYVALHKAMHFATKMARSNKRFLFVSTRKPQAFDIVTQAARQCGQYYVNHRWPGGMLTNWKTISKLINRMLYLEKVMKNPEDYPQYTKKELTLANKKLKKLHTTFDGIRDMKYLPDVIVMIDSSAESIVISEANRLEIPIISLVDTDSNPKGIDYVIPGNDDSRRSIALFFTVMMESVIEGQRLRKEDLEASKAASKAHAVASEAKHHSPAPAPTNDTDVIVEEESKEAPKEEVVVNQ